MVGALVQGVVRLCALRQEPLNAAKRIGVIVPFRNQIALIYKQLRELNIPEANEITIDTVERFQGSQRDIIIYSTTISRPYQLDILSVPIEDHGYMIDRKLNVALTRARKQMFILGNVEVLQRNELYAELIRNTEVRE
jgi:superfamily I DNA and/or RNA helicase